MNARVRALVERARAGDAAGVEIELHEWARQDDCPPAARIVLAAMLAQRGELDAALRTLRFVHDQTDHDTDHDVLRARLAILIQANLTDTARRVTERLYRVHGHRPGVRDWIEAAEPPGTAKLPDVSPAAVERLAAELADDPEVVRSLVVGMKQRSSLSNGGTGVPPVVDPKGQIKGVMDSVVPIDNGRDARPTETPQPDAAKRPIALLRAAIERLQEGYVHDTRRYVMFCTALAELALLAQDESDARRWAHRGLKVDPYCASLALVLASCDDDARLGPPARQALARVARQHPGYPDVRAAMIRRAFADGRVDSARRRLTAWLRRDPGSPLANQLQQELAA